MPLTVPRHELLFQAFDKGGLNAALVAVAPEPEVSCVEPTLRTKQKARVYWFK